MNCAISPNQNKLQLISTGQAISVFFYKKILTPSLFWFLLIIALDIYLLSENLKIRIIKFQLKFTVTQNKNNIVLSFLKFYGKLNFDQAFLHPT